MKVLVIMMALGGAPSLNAGHAWIAPNCVSALEQAYKPFAARQGALTSGDFNSDGQPDFAMLLDRAGHALRHALGGIGLVFLVFGTYKNGFVTESRNLGGRYASLLGGAFLLVSALVTTAPAMSALARLFG